MKNKFQTTLMAAVGAILMLAACTNDSLNEAPTNVPEAITIAEPYTFSGSINDALGTLGCTKLRFVAGSALTSETVIYTDGTDAENPQTIYAVRNGDRLEVHTLARSFKLMGKCSGLFDTAYETNFAGVTEMDLTGWDTSSVTNMMGMFKGCDALEALTLGEGFDTSEVTDMSLMFDGCSSLTSLDLSKFDTSGVTNMNWMFNFCRNLESIRFGEKFITSSVTSMIYMFNECSSLTSLDLSKFDTSGVTNMRSMFSSCSAFETLTFGEGFDTSKVTDMSYMFNGCSSLISLDLSTFDTSEVTDMKSMFQVCDILGSIRFGENFDTSSVTDMYSMFGYCYSLTSLDLTGFTFAEGVDCQDMFSKVGSYNESKTPIYVTAQGKAFLEAQEDTTGIDDEGTNAELVVKAAS